MTSESFHYHCTMGSVGSLIEKQDLSPEGIKCKMGTSQGIRQPDGLLKKGITQRELLNYLNITKKESKVGKRVISGISSIKREHDNDERENIYVKMHYKDDEEIDLTKNVLPIREKFEKSQFISSAFKTVAPKNFSSMQNLYPAKNGDISDSTNSLNTLFIKNGSISSSPPRKESLRNNYFHTVSQEEENMSDSGHNSLNSLPPYKPVFKSPQSQISASMSHINHIGGSLDRGSLGTKKPSSIGNVQFSFKSLAMLNHLSCYGEAPPPYEFSQSLENVVQDLEDRLQEKDHELKQERGKLNKKEEALDQVLDGKQHLWEKEMEELKRIYVAKLRQVSQHAQRSQRTLQLQLFKVQQEKRRLQENFVKLQQDCEMLKMKCSSYQEEQNNITPKLEETKWEVCHKAGEIALLKQQVKASQAEVTLKLSEIFNLKTQLREAKGELQIKDEQIAFLKDSLQAKTMQLSLQPKELQQQQIQTLSLQVERLKAELLLERRQHEAQAANFEIERSTWQEEKEKVIRYQKELQASYLEMYHRNQTLEKEIQEIKNATEKNLSSLPW
uniref:NEDD4 binding protein 3 n=1 Tax=Latimeria chalumnae TaxID=7897 RepID=H3BC21_LATCH